MYLIKRDGTKCNFDMEKFTNYLLKQAAGLNCPLQYIIQQFNVSSQPIWIWSQLAIFLARTINELTNIHPDFAILAGRIYINELTWAMNSLQLFDSFQIFIEAGLLSDKLMNYSSAQRFQIINELDNFKDNTYTYEEIKWMADMYLMNHDHFVEKPQHMLMRISLSIHGPDVDSACHTYRQMSDKYFIHSSSTFLSLGLAKTNFKSYMYTIRLDFSDANEISIENAVYDFLDSTVSKKCDFNHIRIDLSKIPAIDSAGIVDLVPILSNLHSSVYYRHTINHHISVSLNMWHPDVNHFLKMCDSVHSESLTYALIIPDLFMKRVQLGQLWSYMCPKKCPLLLTNESSDSCDGECDIGNCDLVNFEKNYITYEQSSMFVGVTAARLLWSDIIDTIQKTGMPHLIFENSKMNKNVYTTQQLLSASQHHHYQQNSHPIYENIIASHNRHLSLTKNITKTSNLAAASLSAITITNSMSSSYKYIPESLFHSTIPIPTNNIIYSNDETTNSNKNIEQQHHQNIIEEERDELTTPPIPSVTSAAAAASSSIATTSTTVMQLQQQQQQICDDNIFFGCEAATIILPSFYTTPGQFNFNKLRSIVKTIVIDLNTIIDRKREIAILNNLEKNRTNYTSYISNISGSSGGGCYNKKRFSELSDNRREIAIGVDGFADILILMNKTFSESSSLELNIRIFETIYYTAIYESCELAIRNKFNSIQISRKLLNLPFWNCAHLYYDNDWHALRKRINLNGVMNSKFTIGMLNDPIAKLFGHNNGYEPLSSLFMPNSTQKLRYSLVRELIAENTWNHNIEKKIADRRSIQNISEISTRIKNLFKFGAEISVVDQMKMILNRSMFIDHIQKKRIFVDNSIDIGDTLLETWKFGIKSGFYIFT